MNGIRKVADSLHDSDCPDQSGSRPKSARSQRESLPEKYEILARFFDSLDTSIRLLRLKGSSPTFANICNHIWSCLPKQKQCLSLIYGLLENVISGHGDISWLLFWFHFGFDEDQVYMVDEISKEMLLERSNREKPDANSNTRKVPNLSLEMPIEALGKQQLAASHLSGSFRRFFSRKVACNDGNNASQNLSKASLQPLVVPVPELPQRGNCCCSIPRRIVV
ncbi:CDT1-like protein b [Morella rubra]|uniref:CDT1-like protein b n=1 Tax=Morella rubra TaxID=262757 RepID=A0A6A1V8N0_9ROSI|nr:CDT1-like protein b [Morella rubra]